MAIVRWEPFGGLMSFQSFMPEWEDLFPRVNYWPNMDVYREGEDLIFKMEVPEMKPDEINISLNDGYIMINGHHEHEAKEEGKEYYRKERYVGSFTRELPLPKEVNDADVHATMKHGVLEIRIAGAGREVQAARKIPISTSDDEIGEIAGETDKTAKTKG